MSLVDVYRELEADRRRMDFMLRHPDEAASAVNDAYSRWDGERLDADDPEGWQNLLRWELDYQSERVKP